MNEFNPEQNPFDDAPEFEAPDTSTEVALRPSAELATVQVDDIFLEAARTAQDEATLGDLIAIVPTIPVGKESTFVVPDLLVTDLGDDPLSKISGVVLMTKTERNMWPERDSEGNAAKDEDGNVLPPLCKSYDGKTGAGEDSGFAPRSCADCVHSAWQDDEKPRCSQRMNVVILPDGTDEAVILSCSATSLKAIRTMGVALSAGTSKGRGFGRARYEFKLERVAKGGNTFFGLSPRRDGIEEDPYRLECAAAGARMIAGVLAKLQDGLTS